MIWLGIALYIMAVVAVVVTLLVYAWRRYRAYEDPAPSLRIATKEEAERNPFGLGGVDGNCDHWRAGGAGGGTPPRNSTVWQHYGPDGRLVGGGSRTYAPGEHVWEPPPVASVLKATDEGEST